MTYSAHCSKVGILIINSKHQLKGGYYLNNNFIKKYNFSDLIEVVNTANNYKTVKRPNGNIEEGRKYFINKAVDDYFL